MIDMYAQNGVTLRGVQDAAVYNVDFDRNVVDRVQLLGLWNRLLHKRDNHKQHYRRRHGFDFRDWLLRQRPASWGVDELPAV